MQISRNRKLQVTASLIAIALFLVIASGFKGYSTVNTSVKAITFSEIRKNNGVNPGDTVLKGNKLLITDTAITVATPASITASLIEDEWGGGGFWGANLVNYRVYAYKIVNGKYIFSPGYATLSSDFSVPPGANSWVSVSISPVPGADGYRVYARSLVEGEGDIWVISDYKQYGDISTTTFVDYDFFSNGGYGYENEIFFMEVGDPNLSRTVLSPSTNVIQGDLKLDGLIASDIHTSATSLSFYSDTTARKMVGRIGLGPQNTLAFGMNNSMSGYRNIAMGYSALSANIAGSSNIAIGNSALFSNTSGFENIATGNSALASNTTGWSNTGIGPNALFANTTGGYNISLGTSAGGNINTGSNNIAIGTEVHVPSGAANNQLSIGNLIFGTNLDGRNSNISTGNIGIGTKTPAFKLDVAGTGRFAGNLTLSNTPSTSTGSYDILTRNTSTGAIEKIAASSLGGNETGVVHTTGDEVVSGTKTFTTRPKVGDIDVALTSDIPTRIFQYNIATGLNALNNNTTGSYNIATGQNALNENTEGSSNMAFGADVLYYNTTGNSNVAIGNQALYKNTSGSGNIASGQAALYSNTTGSFNIGTGLHALFYNTTGFENIATGFSALNHNTTGSYNIAIGGSALVNNTTGFSNIAIGASSLRQSSSTSHNVSIGHRAMHDNINGGSNVALGSFALSKSISGNVNTATGFQSLPSNTTGSGNTASGAHSLFNNSAGAGNSALGIYSMYSNTTGSNNTALGGSAGRDLQSGYDNTFIGFSSGGGLKTGSGNTILGAKINVDTDSLSNTVIIGDGEGVQRFYSPASGNVLLGHPNNPTDNGFKLDVNGTGRFAGNLRTEGVFESGTSGSLKTISGSVSADRTYTLPDKDGTFAMVSDIENSVPTSNSITSALGYVPANDMEAIHKTGDEIVSGIKTFTTRPNVGGIDLALTSDIPSDYVSNAVSFPLVNAHAVGGYSIPSPDLRFVHSYSDGNAAKYKIGFTDNGSFYSNLGMVVPNLEFTCSYEGFGITANSRRFSVKSPYITSGPVLSTDITSYSVTTTNLDLYKNLQERNIKGSLNAGLLTGSRTFRFPDKSGVFALVEDITSLATTFQPALGYTAANDANVVHQSGAESISGSKTFTNNLKIGSGSQDNLKLEVFGTIQTKAIKVSPNGWADYVFAPNYKLPALADVEKFIQENKHLPDVPSEAEVKKEGIELGDMSAVLLKKIEELTLYLIEKDKQLQKANEKIDELAKKVEGLSQEK
ncbi:hypothetical protein [Pedobacter sp. SYSU D00535]|uniref:beta strand repeat-containing protein n=1 Tax=Pedobacter sp. SYSU D00535 TaxID=2810308 RepID=UPI001A974941|nr:hypothetical protein [Pedobacter sp. SYSU D00535]